MKNYSYLVVMIVIAILFAAGFANAQATRTDGGVIVVDDRLLSPYQKQIVFIVTKNFPREAMVQFQTMTLSGIMRKYEPLHFPEGLKRGQTIPIWNGEFNEFETTPWLRFDVCVTTGEVMYYTTYSTPIAQAEQYKEPMIYEISETKSPAGNYSYFLEGNFDRYSDTTVLINQNIAVTPEDIEYPATSGMRFRISNLTKNVFPTGKFLLTVCQNGHCDTMVGRHR